MNIDVNKAILKIYKYKGYINEYFSHLSQMKTIGIKDSFIDIQLKFMNRIMSKMIFKKYNLNSMSVKKRFKILIFPIQNQTNFEQYYKFEEYYFSFFHDVFQNTSLFDLEYVSKNQIKHVDYKKYDFILEPNIILSNQKYPFKIYFQIFNPIDHDQKIVLNEYILKEDSISKITLDISKKIKENFPIIGKILLKTSRNQFIIDLGSLNGLKEGDHFYFIPSQNFIKKISWMKNTTSIWQGNNYQKIELLLEYYKKLNISNVQVLRLVEINENFSLAELNTLDFQNILNKNGYVVNLNME